MDLPSWRTFLIRRTASETLGEAATACQTVPVGRPGMYTRSSPVRATADWSAWDQGRPSLSCRRWHQGACSAISIMMLAAGSVLLSLVTRASIWIVQLINNNERQRLRAMQLRTEQRAFRSRWSLIFGFLLGVFVGVVATEVVCRGALEFVCDALEFQNLPIGDSKTLLQIVQSVDSVNLPSMRSAFCCMHAWPFASK